MWRIEQFKVVAWPSDLYGSFHTGDSYVVLHSYQKDPNREKLSHDLHIWIGRESSQDEYGTAAYKMVECDDQLGGAAVQHRDVQGKESPLFQSYFKKMGGLKYLEGGAASGFTHVEPTVDVPHLYRVKGTEGGLSLTQLPLQITSLNQGDSFIVFANASTVWVWHGESANPDEKSRANRTAEEMCTEGTVQVLEAGHDDDAAFWAYLEKNGEIGAADDASDETVEQFTPLLFQLPANDEPVAQGEQPVSSKFRWGQSSSPQMDGSHLHDDNVYLLDAGWDLFVWMGAAADVSDKVGALSWADEYCRKLPRTADLPLTLVKAGYEPTGFSGYFRD